MNEVLVIIHTMLVQMPAVLLAGLGGVLCERSGVVNIALEGIMRFGAFFGLLFAINCQNTFLGFLIGGIAGMVLGLILAYFSIHLKSDQIITGLALNIFALGFITFLLELIFGNRSTSKNLSNVGLQMLPEIKFGIETKGSVLMIFDNLNIVVYISIGMVLILHFLLYKTNLGLRIRATGENPRAVDSLGINVYIIRYIAVLIGCFLVGLGGATLSLANLSMFENNMPSGKGFIALAAVIFGKWKPFGVLIAVMLFTISSAIGDFLQTDEKIKEYIPVAFLNALPYIFTLLALAGFVGKMTPPAADGVSYSREDK